MELRSPGAYAQSTREPSAFVQGPGPGEPGHAFAACGGAVPPCELQRARRPLVSSPYFGGGGT